MARRRNLDAYSVLLGWRVTESPRATPSAAAKDTEAEHPAPRLGAPPPGPHVPPRCARRRTLPRPSSRIDGPTAPLDPCLMEQRRSAASPQPLGASSVARGQDLRPPLCAGPTLVVLVGLLLSFGFPRRTHAAEPARALPIPEQCPPRSKPTITAEGWQAFRPELAVSPASLGRNDIGETRYALLRSESAVGLRVGAFGLWSVFVVGPLIPQFGDAAPTTPPWLALDIGFIVGPVVDRGAVSIRIGPRLSLDTVLCEGCGPLLLLSLGPSMAFRVDAPNGPALRLAIEPALIVPYPATLSLATSVGLMF